MKLTSSISRIRDLIDASCPFWYSLRRSDIRILSCHTLKGTQARRLTSEGGTVCGLSEYRVRKGRSPTLGDTTFQEARIRHPDLVGLEAIKLTNPNGKKVSIAARTPRAEVQEPRRTTLLQVRT
jgi:hypothetical protein